MNDADNDRVRGDKIRCDACPVMCYVAPGCPPTNWRMRGASAFRKSRGWRTTWLRRS